MRPRDLLVVAAVLVAAAAIAGVVFATASDDKQSSQPKQDPRVAAVRVVRLIVQNRYGEAWQDLHPVDRRVASKDEYVRCENRSRFTARFVRARAAHVAAEAVGLGNGKFVDSTAVDVLITLRDADVPPFVVRHTVHLVADRGRWTWILPSWRYRDFRADRCPTASSAPSPPS